MDGLNANLWVGLALIVAGLGFGAWARLRPIVIDEAEPAQPGEGTGPGAQ